MNRLHGLILAAAAAAVLAAPAAAKGPSGVSITGPGLAHAVVVRGNAEAAASSRFARLVELAGFFPQAFLRSPDPTLTRRPQGTLGRRFVAVYTVPGPNGRTWTLRQALYPFASGGALTYMSRGQPIFDGATHGGWYRGGIALRRLLVSLGLARGQSL
jgi:hypothetical protein